ncbi:zinc finger BED domain-containing protein 1-like [Rhizophagus clarus]|uniref:Zinc finger BED domain-containing protein 1-like n=1 Tax=Rhizophagus clarus TaxID=94130 RepID=A0A8H3M8X2_9GLOM|nr:zinc finger BED domain-containing protein 1-like [Rhizophagus clarus]
MSLQNKRVKYDARLIKDSTNRTGNTDENELQHYTGSRYFNGEECGHYYNDGSTTSNLIHHLATKHKIYKPGSAEEAKHLKEQPQLDIRVAIKKRKPKSKTEYKQIWQNVTEFIIEDNQPLYVLQSKSFRKLLLSLDEHFEIPCDKSIKLMIGEAFEWSKDQLLELLKVNCTAASITTDFWTSKARHGYISVTCSWISHDWTLCKTLLALQRVRYPHTSEIIKELLNKIFADWAIASKLLTIITNNGTHTLQLTIGKGLNLVKTLILRAKRLIDFFNFSPKQRERLQTAQEFLGYTQIKHVIGDVSTRWNSTYCAWEHLIELKRAIKFLPGQLKSDLNKDAQKDGEKLKKIMLSDNEWLLIEDLLNLLSVFEDVTKLLSGAKYCTISLMYPAIAALIASIKPGIQPSSSNFELNFRENLADDLPDEKITILDSAEVTISDNKNEVEIEVIDLTAVTGHCRKKIDITEPIQTKDIVSNIRKLLYNSMFSYWKDIHKQSVRHEAIGKLRDLYEVVQNDYNISDDTNQMILSAEHTNSTEHHSNRVRKSILDMIYASPNPADSSEEIDKYLEINEEYKETNPLEWWKLHEKRFPTLAIIARKYLGICAISVPSERLFSDIGNNITNKKINLDPNLVEQMLFLKRNINVMGSIFPPI